MFKAFAIILAFLSCPIFGQELDVSFDIIANAVETADGDAAMVIELHPATGHYVYAESVSAALPGGTELAFSESVPPAVRKFDPILEQDLDVYDRPARLYFTLPEEIAPGDISSVDFSYQACNESICFMPATVRLAVGSGGAVKPENGTRSEPVSGGDLPEPFNWSIRISESGYHGVESFLEFLDRAADTEKRSPTDRLQSLFDRGAFLWLILLVLAGGLALNLTPCVLPMIPVNLAVIGAGARGGSSRRGFALGTIYGCGMAVAYGFLGFLVVFAGAQFGALNASWWFNLAIAIVFFVLALAMFDVITIDFSRWRIGSGPRGAGSGLTAFGFGALSAVLAGACVAPVVISVLLLSAGIYAGGSVVGLLLPFLLGLGMALPWPFAGAGLSVLPKPGNWMNRVKWVFGIIILLLALYYGLQAFKLGEQAWQRRKAGSADLAAEVAKLTQAADEARRRNKPLLVDFWATWCKNCLAMDRTTFKDPEVEQRLKKDFVFVKFQAEQPSEAETKKRLQAFHVIGLPTYVVLTPPDENGEQDGSRHGK